MFTGIVETSGEILKIETEGNNRKFLIQSDLVPSLRVDQSVNHNGVCLTIEELFTDQNAYQVSAIHETLSKTTLAEWKDGEKINLERAMTLNQRLDGHMVQGHVDQTLECIDKTDQEGSTIFTFHLPRSVRHLLIPQGSITLDGISLTVAGLEDENFSVAIIPYTYNHTNVGYWKPGRMVNVEFDVLAKYLARYRELYSEDFARLE